MQKIVIDPGAKYVNTAPCNISGKPARPGQIAYSCSGNVHAWLQNYKPTLSDFLPPTSPGQLKADGSSLMAMALPTNPAANMGQFLGELYKDGLPSLISIKKWQRALSSFRAFSRHGSREYLNVQFGWAPFIRDIVDTVKVTLDISKRIQQYARDSGKPIRRRRSLPTTQTITTSGPITNYGQPAFPVYNYLSSGKMTTTVTTSREVWFSGAFTYCLPIGEDAVAKLKRFEAHANKLLGLRLTPDLLYKLTPWTWLIDWITNLGAIVRNYSALQNDKLVLLYGYVMERKVQLTQYSLEGVVMSDGQSVSSHQSITKTTLSRLRATPYGFGLDSKLFTPFQWSIIAALGISKAPRSLNF